MQSVIRSLRPWKSVRGVLEVGIVNEEERRVHSRSRLINTWTRAWKTRRLETEYSNTSLTGFTCSSASCSSQDGSRTARGDRGRCDKSYDMDGYKVWFSPPGFEPFMPNSTFRLPGSSRRTRRFYLSSPDCCVRSFSWAVCLDEYAHEKPRVDV